MKTCDLEIFAFDNAASRIIPAFPTNGLPRKSSNLPGASPTNMIFADEEPSPGTAFFLVLQS
jgi:hypothetical protein